MVRDNPDVKLLIFVCDPVKRVFSHVKQHLAQLHISSGRQFNDSDILTCMNQIVNGLENSTSHKLRIPKFENHDLTGTLTRGNYMANIRPWLKYFKTKNIHFVDGSNLGEHGCKTFRFLHRNLIIRKGTS